MDRGARPGEAAREAVELTSLAPPPQAPPSGRQAGFAVEARLVDARGDPLATGELTLRGPETAPTARANDAGDVELVVPPELLTTRRLEVVARARGTVWRTYPIRGEILKPGGKHSLGEIVLAPGGTLVGRVVVEAGEPVARARVIARLPAAQPYPTERFLLPWSWFGDNIDVTSSSDAQGRFRLEGAPAGWAEVLASDYEHLVGRSEALEVVAGGETRVPDIVLPAAEALDRIRGRVVDAAGAAKKEVRVSLMSADEEAIYHSVASDAEGRFAFLGARDATYVLVAQDPGSRLKSRVKNVRTGQAEALIVLAGVRTLAVEARDENGPVASFRVLLEDERHRGLTGYSSHEPGLARAEIPAELFHVLVLSPLHRPERLGPFEPAGTPERLEVVLTRVGGISGVVRAGGTSIAGAEVHVHAALADATFARMALGFVSFVEPYVLGSVRSDESGRFFVPLQTSGRYRVHAASDGRGRAASAWIPFEDGQALRELQLELPSPGAIEGRLLVASGVDPRAAWIGATDGEGHVELVQCEADRRFRFDGLAPGGWQVRRVDGGQELNLRANPVCWPADEADEPPPWDVQVPAGGTARLDLDLRDEVPCTLDGRLTFNGAGPRGFQAVLTQTRASLDGDGRFTMHVPRSGRAWLGFHAADVSLETPLELVPGPNTWELDLPTGSVQLEDLPAVPPDPRQGRAEDWPEYALLWTRGELRWMALLQENASGSARLAEVPAGTLVLRWRGPGSRPDGVLEWPVLSELELAPGASAIVRVPSGQ
jgi:hypothetical protein